MAPKLSSYPQTNAPSAKLSRMNLTLKPAHHVLLFAKVAIRSLNAVADGALGNTEATGQERNIY